MINKTGPYLLQFVYVIIGLIFLISTSYLSKKIGINPTIPTLILFLVGYFGLAYFLKVSSLKAYWQLQKAHLLIIGIIAGIIIQGIPVFMTHPTALSKEMLVNLLNQTALSGTFFTLLIVLWEELWFRNPILNLAQDKRQQVLLSIFTGLLFAALHLMNPKINLLQEGPELLLAGILLTISYYASGSFWLPLGLHFGNNIFSSLIEKSKLVPESSNIGITNELVFRWIVLAVAIGITFLYWPGEKKKAV
jgi:membrane protease YdiL (CAAX protease family)